MGWADNPLWLWPAPGLAAFLAAAFWLGFCWRPDSWTKSAVKTGSVALLALAAPWTVTGGLLLGLALGLCALGDYALSRPGGFLAGIGAFAAGHLAYIALFLTSPHSAPETLLGPEKLVLGAALCVFAAAMAAVLFPRTGSLCWAVLAYVPVIAAMAFTSLGFPPFSGLWMVPLAALLFLASDTVLAAEVFLIRPGSRVQRVLPFVVWPLYWLAQFGFFLGLGWIPVK